LPGGKDVKLYLPVQPRDRPRSVMKCGMGIAVHTGVDSRSELKFTLKPKPGYGASTLFGFVAKGRATYELAGCRPCCCGFRKERVGKIFQRRCPPQNHRDTGDAWVGEEEQRISYKFIVLEGSRGFICQAAGSRPLVKSGQMIIVRLDSEAIPEPVDVDIGKITQNSSLSSRGFRPRSEI